MAQLIRFHFSNYKIKSEFIPIHIYSQLPGKQASTAFLCFLFKTCKTSRNPFITRQSSCPWKMKPGRSINSSAVHHENFEFRGVKKQLVNKDLKQTNSFRSSDTAYDEEYPPLSSSKVKRRSRIDLGTQHEKKSAKEARDAGLLQQAASSTSQQDDSSLPTSFGKKYVPRDNRRPMYLRDEGSSDCAERQPVIDPFDICLPSSSKSDVKKMMSLESNMEQDSEIVSPIIETRQLLRPGMILLTNYISLGEQVEIIKKCRELGLGPGGFYQPGYQDGAKLRLRMMCLGKKWDPETKYEEQIQSDDSEPPGIPAEFVLLVERALLDSHALIKKHGGTNKAEEILPGMFPDICIVNFYTTNGKLGLHQDRDESRDSLSRGLPVVSFSVGDTAEFLYGDQRNVNKAERILLRSGDVLIFGGKSRHIFHGVTSIIPNSAPPALLKEAKLCPGRLNLTFRQF